MKKRVLLLAIPVAVAAAIAAVTVRRTRGSGAPAVQTGIELRCDAEYRAYRASPAPRPGSPWGLSDEARAHLKEMGDLGPPVVPFLVEKLKTTGDTNLELALIVATAKGFHGSDYVVGDQFDRRLAQELWVRWWEGGQQAARREFEELYAAEDRDGVRRLGVAALPGLMRKLEGGDTSMLGVVRRIVERRMRGTSEQPVPDLSTASACLAWWEANKEDWLLPWPGQEQAGG